MKTFRGKVKVAAYRQFEEDINADSMEFKTGLDKLKKDLRDSEKNNRAKITSTITVRVGYFGDDLIRSRFTILASGFGYYLPSFLHRDYNRNRNRK